jgi:hypothetical protein
MDPVALEQGLLAEMAEYAENAGVLVLLEPLDHTETHLLVTLEESIGICTTTHSSNIALMADLYQVSQGITLPSGLQTRCRGCVEWATSQVEASVRGQYQSQPTPPHRNIETIPPDVSRECPRANAYHRCGIP